MTNYRETGEVRYPQAGEFWTHQGSIWTARYGQYDRPRKIVVR